MDAWASRHVVIILYTPLFPLPSLPRYVVWYCWGIGLFEVESRACKLGRFRDGQELGPVYKKERKKKKGEGKGKGRRGEGEVGKRFGFVTLRGIVFGNYTRITRDACISLVFLFLFFRKDYDTMHLLPFLPLFLSSSFGPKSILLSISISDSFFFLVEKRERRGIGLFSYAMT